MKDLIALVENFGRPQIALIGDFMLDRYVYGDVERISPEAPVPILKVFRSESRSGGAGNVARAICALGGKVSCVGVIGQDAPGDELLRLLLLDGAVTASLVRMNARPTSVKTRYAGLPQHKNAQQILRVDEEVTDAFSDELHRSLKAAIFSQLADAKVLAIQDHNKGVITDRTGPEIIAAAAKVGCPVVVDPAMVKDYRRYYGATLLTPNRFEAALASGVPITDEASLRQAARQLLLIAEAQAVAVTLDREGVFLMERGGEGRHIPTRQRSPRDGTGAGDEVLAALSVSLAEGCDYAQAVAVANVAGGLEVERFGVVPIRKEEIIEDLRQAIGLRGRKVMDRQRLLEEVQYRRERGERIVFTNGCFDLLHMGHVRYLKQARELGNCLIVAINSDDSVRRLKGASRPVIGEQERAEMLGALECVDYVTIFEEDTPIPLLELLRPEMLVKGGSTPVVVGQELVESYGGEVKTLDLVQGLSTTDIINRIMESGQ